MNKDINFARNDLQLIDSKIRTFKDQSISWNTCM